MNNKEHMSEDGQIKKGKYDKFKDGHPSNEIYIIRCERFRNYEDFYLISAENKATFN